MQCSKEYTAASVKDTADRTSDSGKNTVSETARVPAKALVTTDATNTVISISARFHTNMFFVINFSEFFVFIQSYAKLQKKIPLI